MERKRIPRWAVLLLAAFILVLAIFGPELLARYRDRFTLNQIHAETVDQHSEGYRYALSSNEKLFLLSQCLSRQSLPESELSAATRVEAAELDYEGFIGTYAFVVNRQGPSGKEITEEEIFQVCNEEIITLKARGVLPESVREVDETSYEAVLYSAIDVLEPRNNLSVWRVSLSTSQQNADKANRLIDAYIDGDTGRIYSFYARTETTWAELEPDKMMENWSDYLGLTGMEPAEAVNPLLETTSDFLKYRFPGMGEGTTMVTIGFYEGINELFLKIT